MIKNTDPQHFTTARQALRRNLRLGGLLAAGIFGLCVVSTQAYAEEHPMICPCPGCTASASSGEVGFDTFRLNNRWSSTATNSNTGARGNPITLTWGIVADGTPIADGGVSGESSDNSSLITRLDTIYYGSAQAGPITNRVWFDEFEDSYNRWAEISGLTFVYQPGDNGTNVNGGSSGSNSPGTPIADMRIGGHSLDGNSGVLAYNYYPGGGAGGNMVIDTNDSYYTNTNSE